MGISKEKEIRMLYFTFKNSLEKKYPFLSNSVIREIATLAALNFNHNKYEDKMIKMHHEKEDLEKVLIRKKQRLREYEDAIIRRNEYINELKEENEKLKNSIEGKYKRSTVNLKDITEEDIKKLAEEVVQELGKDIIK